MRTKLNLQHLREIHALDLPDWGTWSKRYVGGSLIADDEQEILMEFPFAVRTFGYPLVSAGPDRTGIERLRQWKTDDALTLWQWRFIQPGADYSPCPPSDGGGIIEYVPLAEDALVVHAQFYKNTPGISQRYSFDFCAGQAPTKVRLRPAYRERDLWIPAQAYVCRDAQYIAPMYRLRPGVGRFNGASDGEALLLSFKDGAVGYKLELKESLAQPRIALRYMLPCGDEDQPLVLTVDGKEYPFGLPVDACFATGQSPDDWRMCDLAVQPLGRGRHEIRLRHNGRSLTRRPAHVVIDGFLICREQYDWRREKSWESVPQTNGRISVERDLAAGALILRNENLHRGQYFALAGRGGLVHYRRFETADIAAGLKAVGAYWWCHGDYRGAKSVADKFVPGGGGESAGHVDPGSAVWANVNHTDLWVCPGHQDECYSVVVREESRAEAVRRAQDVLNNLEKHLAPKKRAFLERTYRAPGQKYAEVIEHLVSNAILCACYSGLLGAKSQKAVGCFPLQNQPYLWDTGFQALGLAPYSPQLALEMANLFFPAPGEETPAILYGTPLLANFYAVWEVCQQTAEVEVARVFYPLMKRTYNWCVHGDGNSPSVFDTLKLDAFCGFRAWHALLGADDYPAMNFHVPYANYDTEIQPWARDRSNCGDRETVTRGGEWDSDDVGVPGQTAHLIRYGQLLRNMAHWLGLRDDIPTYEADQQRFNRTLQENMWDAETGYYAFTKGRDYRHVVDQTGKNFNMGFDGVTPLITHLCPPDRIARMLANLKSPAHLWSEFGLSNIDRSASYFKPDGYWNGSLWHPHQWFLWKALLDVDPAFAREIAFANLETAWREHNRDLRLPEHYRVSNGRGNPCELASLNGPLAVWNAAYHQEGTITVGYDTLVHRVVYDPGRASMKLEISAPYGPATIGVIACLKPNGRYRASVWEGTRESSEAGDIAFTLPAPRQPVEIRVDRVG